MRAHVGLRAGSVSMAEPQASSCWARTLRKGKMGTRCPWRCQTDTLSKSLRAQCSLRRPPCLTQLGLAPSTPRWGLVVTLAFLILRSSSHPQGQVS